MDKRSTLNVQYSAFSSCSVAGDLRRTVRNSTGPKDRDQIEKALTLAVPMLKRGNGCAGGCDGRGQSHQYLESSGGRWGSFLGAAYVFAAELALLKRNHRSGNEITVFEAKSAFLEQSLRFWNKFCVFGTKSAFLERSLRFWNKVCVFGTKSAFLERNLRF
jgi:hypothetical protein